jgi:hypothetical protein
MNATATIVSPRLPNDSQSDAELQLGIPVLASLITDMPSAPNENGSEGEVATRQRKDTELGEPVVEGQGDGLGLEVDERDFEEHVIVRRSISRMLVAKQVLEAPDQTRVSPSDPSKAVQSIRIARCKSCGELIPRDMDAIEQHSLECPISVSGDPSEGRERKKSIIGTLLRSASLALRSDRDKLASFHDLGEKSRLLGGIVRRPELEKKDTRVIYRIGRSVNNKYRPREVCALQVSIFTI